MRCSRSSTSGPLQPGADHRPRVADLVAHPVVAHRAGRLRQLARRVLLVLRACRAALRSSCFSSSPTFASSASLRSLSCWILLDAAVRRRGLEPLDVVGDLLLLAGDLLGLPQRVCDVALGAAGLRLLQLALRLLQPLERRRRPAPRRSARRWPPPAASHRRPRAAAAPTASSSGRFSSRDSCSSRRAASSACSASCALAAAPPPPTPAGRRGALRAAARPPAPAAAPAPSASPSARRASDRACCCWARWRGLVLVRHLVELQLEQVGEVLRPSGSARRRRRRHPAGAASAPASRTLPRPSAGTAAPSARAASAPSGLGRLQLGLGVLHLGHRLRQQVRDLLERRDPAATSRLFMRVSRPSTCSRSLRLRQREHRRVLAQLVGRHRLAIALDVEGRGDDLPLLLRQRADLAAAAAATAAAAGVRLGALELLAAAAGSAGSTCRSSPAWRPATASLSAARA